MSTWRGLVAQIERVATRAGRRRAGRFAIEGFRLHERALRAGVRVEDVVVAASLHDRPGSRSQRLLEDLGASGSRLHVAPDDVLQRLTDGRGLGALVGLVPIPVPCTLDRCLDRGPQEPVVFLVALEVADPGNAGALVRTAHALGARAFVAAGRTDPYHPRAVRTSMGSLFRCPVVSYPDLGGAFEDLARCHVHTIAAVSRGGVPLDELRLEGPRVAVLIGNEATGLPGAVQGRVALKAAVPMVPDVDSLSANAAAAVLLHEVRRIVAASAGVPCAGPAGALRFGAPEGEEDPERWPAATTG